MVSTNLKKRFRHMDSFFVGHDAEHSAFSSELYCYNSNNESIHHFLRDNFCEFRSGSKYIEQLVCFTGSVPERPSAMVHTPQRQEIFPRPKKSVEALKQKKVDKPAPVLITPQLLDSLRGLSLPKAASTIGISSTAFKRACRRLGVTRWSFTRGPARNIRSSGRFVSRAAGRRVGALTPGDSGLSQLWSPSHVSPELDDSAWPPYIFEMWSGTGDSWAENRSAADHQTEPPNGIEQRADDALVLEMLSWPWPT